MQNDGPRNISTGMKSLIKLLNSYEEGFDGDNDNQEILEPLVNQIGNTVDKTSRDYIWNNGSAAASGHQDTIETVAGDIKETIRALQNELKTKSTQITELKTILARKKLSKESDLRNMKEDCEKREESLRQEFEKKEQMLQRQVEKNQESISDLYRKKISLEKQSKHVEQEIPSLCRQLEQEGLEELSKECQRWKVEERTKLNKLAKAKGSEMRVNAAKALEPKLIKLVQEHNENKTCLRNDIGSKLHLHMDKFEDDLRLKLKNEHRRIDNKMKAESVCAEESYKAKLAQLNVQLKRKLEEVELKTIRDKEESLSLYRTSLEEDKARSGKQISIYEEDCRREVNLKKEQTHQKLLQLKSNVATRVDKEKCRIDSKIVEWKRQETLLISEDVNSFVKAEEDGIKANAENALSIIEEKLCENLKARKRDTKTRHEAEMKIKVERSEIKLKLLNQYSSLTQKEYEELKQEEKILRNELKQRRVRMVAALENLHTVETSLKAEKDLGAEKDLEKKIRQVDKQEELRRTKLALQMTTKKLHFSKCKIDENKIALEIEIQALQEVDEEELKDIQGKIDQILGSKRQCVKHKKDELSSIQEQVIDTEAKLSRIRQAEILN